MGTVPGGGPSKRSCTDRPHTMLCRLSAPLPTTPETPLAGAHDTQLATTSRSGRQYNSGSCSSQSVHRKSAGHHQLVALRLDGGVLRAAWAAGRWGHTLHAGSDQRQGGVAMHQAYGVIGGPLTPSTPSKSTAPAVPHLLLALLNVVGVGLGVVLPAVLLEEVLQASQQNEGAGRG